mmetsp:Transcript_29833/g.77008  ORF Transcript_29833/g.77008 Transcript_29833/m.77008 type:complete len:292 (-) Transcript_29833:1427-2302(-)
MHKIFGDKKKTFHKKKGFVFGSKLDELHRYAKKALADTISGGNLIEAVRLPEGEDLNEWLAVNTMEFYNNTNLIYGAISEFCDEKSCPIMSAGKNYEYFWMDEVQKKPVRVPAPIYVDRLMLWIEALLDDERTFPSELGNPFPNDFVLVVKTIFKRMFRIYAHIYYSHLSSIIELKLESHYNTLFKHISLFILEFDLVDKKELAPLQELIDRFSDLAAAGKRREAKAVQFDRMAALPDPKVSSRQPPGVSRVHNRSRSMVHHADGLSISGGEHALPPPPLPEDESGEGSVE